MRRYKLLPCFIFISVFLTTGLAYADFTVTNLDDSGEGSLRWAIEQANANPGADTIDFGVFGTIFPESPLPQVSDDETAIDASSQWSGGQPGITLDGGGAGEGAEGLRLSGANNCHVLGLFITNFDGKGVLLHNDAQLNTVGGAGEGERNVISGNGEHGIGIWDPGTGSNTVSGNYIGTDVDGTGELGNGGAGVFISNGSQWNVVGGIPEGERNIISGNHDHGVGIWDLGTNNNVVSGNYIGTDVTGLIPLGNEGHGIAVYGAAQLNIIGGTTEGEGNVISANGHWGIAIGDPGTSGNVVSGNLIGTDASGTAGLRNRDGGVVIHAAAQLNTIGGTTEGERNTISGNDGAGIGIWDPGTDSNVVLGNYIGTDFDGAAPLGNSWNGVTISNGACSNTIGGETEGERNLISGNNGAGVEIWGFGTNDNVISGNYIGTDVGGTEPLGNGWNGVFMGGEAQSNIIEENLISGNHGGGVEIGNCSDTRDNVVSGNYIGTDFTGTAPLGNSWNGVSINGGAESNTIGGETEEKRNIISGNHDAGVSIWNLGTAGNEVLGNYIGTDVSGAFPLGNSGVGVAISGGAQSNVIEGNVVSGNGWTGVDINDEQTNENVVSGNYIGTNASGTAGMGNSYTGVTIGNGAQLNIIGGTTEDERNVISANDHVGVAIWNSGTDNNVVSGNYIGTDVTGNEGLGNTSFGVHIDGGQSNTIGGATDGARNIISANVSAGVGLWGSNTSDNVVLGNYIGTNADGTERLGNSWNGVSIWDGAHSNIIGGTDRGEENVISGNEAHGVEIQGALNNTVSGNYIGTDAGGTADLGNNDVGVRVFNDAVSVIQGNTIAYNTMGVACYDEANPDLGGGGAITRGLNGIYDNADYDVYNETTNMIMAEWNWWGTSEPDPGQFYGSVDYDPWLMCPAGVSLSSNPSELDTLRAFRDSVLTQSETGRWLIDAYYACAPELVQILLQNPDLGIRSAAILRQLTPGIKFLLGDRRNGSDIVMTGLLVNRIQKLLADIGAVGSDELADTLSEISKMLDGFKGMRISKIWRSLK